MSDQRAGGISWTSETWNVLRGCSRISNGCTACYAERLAIRLSGPGKAYDGLVVQTKAGPRWTGVVRLVPELLLAPARWTRPRLVFVNAMSDLFHESLFHGHDGTTPEIDAVVAAMIYARAAGRGHAFQVLTKRAILLRRYFESGTAAMWADRLAEVAAVELDAEDAEERVHNSVLDLLAPECNSGWPPRNVWWGVSVEDQESAADRIPHLVDARCGWRKWVSYEPALGPVDFRPWTPATVDEAMTRGFDEAGGAKTFSEAVDDTLQELRRGVQWIVVGGESGSRRPFDPDWARDVKAAANAAGVPVFVKQFGAEWHRKTTDLGNGKGADPAKWPEDLRVQEMPDEMVAVAVAARRSA